MNTIKVFINGTSANSAGGKTILKSFLRAAANSADKFRYVVAVPTASDYDEFQGSRLNIISLEVAARQYLIPYVCAVVLPKMAAREQCRLILNFGDIPLRSELPQVFFFDWPYAAYPNSEAWRLGGYKSRLVRKVKLFLFKFWLNKINVIIVQTPEIARQILSLYQFSRINVIPSGVLFGKQGGSRKNFNLGTGYKLLCLSRYYPHKNIEILIPVAQRVLQTGSDIKFIVTISASDHRGAHEFIERVNAMSLERVIINVGSVMHEDIPSLFEQVDAVILPTLLESYGLPYLEAMFFGKPILTSRREFSVSVCEDAAIYFDPYNANEIFEQVLYLANNPEESRRFVEKGKSLLAQVPTLQEIYMSYVAVFDSLDSGAVE